MGHLRWRSGCSRCHLNARCIPTGLPTRPSRSGCRSVWASTRALPPGPSLDGSDPSSPSWGTRWVSQSESSPDVSLRAPANVDILLDCSLDPCAFRSTWHPAWRALGSPCKSSAPRRLPTYLRAATSSGPSSEGSFPSRARETWRVGTEEKNAFNAGDPDGAVTARLPQMTFLVEQERTSHLRSQYETVSGLPRPVIRGVLVLHRVCISSSTCRHARLAQERSSMGSYRSRCRA